MTKNAVSFEFAINDRNQTHWCGVVCYVQYKKLRKSMHVTFARICHITERNSYGERNTITTTQNKYIFPCLVSQIRSDDEMHNSHKSPITLYAVHFEIILIKCSTLAVSLVNMALGYSVNINSGFLLLFITIIRLGRVFFCNPSFRMHLCVHL